MLAAEERDYLIELIDSAIGNDCFGDDDSAYDAWENISDKLKKGYGLCSMEQDMVKKWLLSMADGCEAFEYEERELMRIIAGKVTC